ncbi:unnamed protein product, partial [Sphacelaria rigidula]
MLHNSDDNAKNRNPPSTTLGNDARAQMATPGEDSVNIQMLHNSGDNAKNRNPIS